MLRCGRRRAARREHPLALPCRPCHLHICAPPSITSHVSTPHAHTAAPLSLQNKTSSLCARCVLLRICVRGDGDLALASARCEPRACARGAEGGLRATGPGTPLQQSLRCAAQAHGVAPLIRVRLPAWQWQWLLGWHPTFPGATDVRRASAHRATRWNAPTVCRRFQVRYGASHKVTQLRRHIISMAVSQASPSCTAI
jgi:hypothetical protein